MLDTKLISVLIEDEFKSAIVPSPLRVPADFECDSFVVLEAVPVFEYVTDAEFDCTCVLVPVERIQVVPDEAVQVVAVVAGAPIPGR